MGLFVCGCFGWLWMVGSIVLVWCGVGFGFVDGVFVLVVVVFVICWFDCWVRWLVCFLVGYLLFITSCLVLLCVVC